MTLHQTAIQKNKKRGYAAFLLCGLCAALNVLAYLPAKTFEEAEAVEFTTTTLLLLIFVIAGFFGMISTIKNRRDGGLLLLLIVTVLFCLVSTYSGSWPSKTRVALQLSYAVLVLAFGTIRLLAIQRDLNSSIHS
jgi:uncharacterized membrane protein HdeD (DUF308 family)